jgi:hypothetical protein
MSRSRSVIGIVIVLVAIAKLGITGAEIVNGFATGVLSSRGRRRTN